jgi:hypothetical protein
LSRRRLAPVAVLLVRYVVHHRFANHASLTPLKAKKAVSYAESSDEDEDPFESMRSQRTRQRRPRPSVPDDDDDDVYEAEDNAVEEEDDGTNKATMLNWGSC